MKSRKRSSKFFELLMPLLMLLIWSCSTTQVNSVQDAALRARLESIKKAAIKPDVQIERKKYAGEFEPQLDEDQTVATRPELLVVDQFTRLGFASSDAKLAPGTGQMIQSAYDQLDYVAQRKIEHPTMDAAFPPGPELAATTRKLGAEAVVL